MTETTRRSFLQTASVSALAAGTLLQSVQAGQASEKITVGLIGCGGRGSGVAQDFAGEANCEVVALADPDGGRAGSLAKALGKDGRPQPKVMTDFRQLLEDQSIDAVIVATPDHWHAPASILACEAGKHVYVEKPCSHNLREGRLLVEAAARNKRVVQHGTQSRNLRLIVGGMQLLKEGAIGEVLVAKAWNVQRRGNIGKGTPGDAPAGLDYDLWVGPAEYVPYQSNRLHYNWHWWYNFGTGDMGNDGVHELDYARWGLGVETHPARIAALGGKLYFDDDQQFPDTQHVVFEYPAAKAGGRKKMLVWEMRIWSRNSPLSIDNGVEFYGTQGTMVLTKRGFLELRDDNNKEIKPQLKTELPELKSHAGDFLDAIRNDRKPNADIAIGHLSSSLCHLGNIATRVGRTLEFDPATETIRGDEEAARLISRTYRENHWAIPAGV